MSVVGAVEDLGWCSVPGMVTHENAVWMKLQQRLDALRGKKHMSRQAVIQKKD